MHDVKRDAILISGYFGFGNLGDEAILEAVVSEVRRRDPAARLIVCSGDPDATARRYGVDAVDFFSAERTGEAISRCRAVLFGLGGVFQDYWGAYAANLFRPGTDGIEAYTRPALFARLHGVPAVLFCGGIGPLTSAEGRALFSLACRFADTLIVRDEASAEEVRLTGFGVRPLIAADPGFLLTASTGDVEAVSGRLARAGVGAAPLVAFALRPWRFEVEDAALAEAAGAAAAALPAGWKAVFVPFQSGGSSDDAALAREAVRRSAGRGEVIEVATPGEAIALFARARATVGMRLHATILSACAGTPAVPLVYDPKVASAAEALGLAELCTPVSDLSRLRPALERAIAAAETLRPRLAMALEEARAAARSAFDVLDSVLEGAPARAAAPEAGVSDADLKALLEESGSSAKNLHRLLSARHRRRLATLRHAGTAPQVAAEAEEAADDEERLRQLADGLRRASFTAIRSRERALNGVKKLRRELEAARAETRALRQELSERKAEWKETLRVDRNEHRREKTELGRALSERKAEWEETLRVEREREAEWEETLRVERNEHRREKTELGRALSDAHHELAQIHHSKLWKAGLVYWKLHHGLRDTAQAVAELIRRAKAALSKSAAVAPETAAPESDAVEAAGSDAPPSPCPIANASRHDVVCFPIIDWDFRFQRPQQLMSCFGRAGHRVFYIAQQFRADGPPWEARRKAENVWEVSLRGPTRNVYKDLLDEEALEQLWRSLDAMRRDLSLSATASVVQLPFWWPLARRARAEWVWPVVYDCMDHHAGFSTNEKEMLDQEEELLSGADLVLASSSFLDRGARAKNGNVLVVRNACDYAHFAKAGSGGKRGRRPLVGYYGAISDWFDADLAADLAERRPDWDFVLVGSTFGADTSRLSKLPNVTLPGEKPYAEIPSWLAKFDVAFIPFKRIPLTEATNPVKAYEILAAGKPLVAVPLPELQAMAPHVRLGSTPEELEREITAALAEAGSEQAAAARRAFAAQNTWEKRFEALAPAVSAAFPKVSVVIVTYNNLRLNRMCLESVFGRTEWPNLEIFAVDNASSDGTPAYLQEAQQRWPGLRVILNQKNWGFAAASNMGLKDASGHYLVLLNNDTVVSRGWATALVRHLARDPKLGLVGPVTNEIGNEAKVAVDYRRLPDMPAWAGAWVRAHDGEAFALPMLAMFCVALRRDTMEKVGLLDERFGVGMFEDDDYTRRLRMAGYDIRCARDSFVHHAGRASFKLLGDKRYFEIFEQNRALYQEKWGEMWEPHLDDLDRKRIPNLRARLVAIQAEAGAPPDRIAVFLPSIGWNTPLLQRPHHLASTLARQGWLVFFDCTGSLIDDFADFVKAERNLWLYKGPRGVLETLERPVLWTLPYNVTKAARFGRSLLVYDIIDDLAVFPYNQETLRKNYEQALRDADLVLCVARPLLEKTRRQRPDALYLANAVEYERFAEPKGEVTLDPAFQELVDAGRPIVGYYGALASWFDTTLLGEVARKRSDWSFAVIAKRLLDAPPTGELEKLPNVRFLEPKPYVELPRYLEKFTAAMIPFRVNDITRATSPLKMYEYFAGGKPVIAPPMPECQAFAEVLVVKNTEEFSRALDEARRRAEDPAFVERLRQLGRENSWASRAETVIGRLAEISEPRRPIHPRDIREVSDGSAQPAESGSGKVAAPSGSEGRTASDAVPAALAGIKALPGRCNVCGKETSFAYDDPALFRESLICGHCRTTSRYRSIARGLLRAVRDLTGLEADSLAALASLQSPSKAISVYDTQQPFAFEKCAYPLPDLLRKCRWIDVHTSAYRPAEKWGRSLGRRSSNQNLEKLTFADASFDIVVTTDVMEHVRLDELAHREIRRVLRPGGIYLFTVPHFRDRETLVRVRVTDADDPSKDQYLMEPEYHGDANSEGNRALAYRAYGRDLDDRLRALGFEFDYTKEEFPPLGILNTELFYCRLEGSRAIDTAHKTRSANAEVLGNRG